jgi:hypothetical protein
MKKNCKKCVGAYVTYSLCGLKKTISKVENGNKIK